MTPEQIEQCKNKFPTPLLKEINDRRYELADAYGLEEDRYQKEIKRLNEEVEQNQARCPHPNPFCEYIPDPWHSYYMCNLCGKQGVRPSCECCPQSHSEKS